MYANFHTGSPVNLAQYSNPALAAGGAAMVGFAGRRLLYLIPVLLAVTLLTFLIGALLPGDLAVAILADQATPAQVAALRYQMGLDQPLLWRRPETPIRAFVRPRLRPQLPPLRIAIPIAG
jgi:hypothetical protein